MVPPPIPYKTEETTKISFGENKEVHDSNNDTKSEGAKHNKTFLQDDNSLGFMRSTVGHGVSNLSDTVNDNLIAFRYGAMASIGLLAAYGLVQSPLFFRYHTAKDIPASFFRARKTIPARLLRTVQQGGGSSPDEPILCHVRHLSLVERVLPTSQYRWLMSMHPAAALGKSPEESSSQMILVQIAGIQNPPDYLSQTEQPGEWLDRLARERTTVSCQLLARRVRERDEPQGAENTVAATQNKRPIPGYDKSDGQMQLSTAASKHVAVAKVFYRPKTFQFFSTDIAVEMVRFGRAGVSSDGLYPHRENERVIDSTSSVRDLAYDVAYMDRLSHAEYEGAKGSYGMWADSTVRKNRSDIVEEVDFQTKAPMWKKVWRWIRGG